MGINTYYKKDLLTGEWKEVLKKNKPAPRPVNGSRELLRLMRILLQESPAEKKGAGTGGMFHLSADFVRRSRPVSYGKTRKHSPSDRKSLKNAVATAAYNSRSAIYDQETGTTFDYTRHSDSAEYVDILLPSNAPEWAGDRERLWNEVQKREHGERFQLSRSFEMAFPLVFTMDQKKEAAAAWCKEFTDDGYACDIAFHTPKFKYMRNPFAGQVMLDDDGNPIMNKDGNAKKEPAWIQGPCRKNPHMHVQSTLRGFDPSRKDGWTKRKWRWNSKNTTERKMFKNRSEELVYQRARWADVCNDILQREYPDQYEELKVDHRSYADRGIDKVPTRHRGPQKSSMDRKEMAFGILAEYTMAVEDKEHPSVSPDELKEALVGMEGQDSAEVAALVASITAMKNQQQDYFQAAYEDAREKIKKGKRKSVKDRLEALQTVGTAAAVIRNRQVLMDNIGLIGDESTREMVSGCLSRIEPSHVAQVLINGTQCLSSMEGAYDIARKALDVIGNVKDGPFRDIYTELLHKQIEEDPSLSQYRGMKQAYDETRSRNDMDRGVPDHDGMEM